MLSKRLLCSLLVFSLLTTLLVACGGNGTKESTPKESAKTSEEQKSKPAPITLKYWYWYDNDQHPEKKIAEDFSIKNPNIKIESELVGWNDFHSKLLIAVSAGNPPDISGMSLPWLPEFSNMDALLNLDPLYNKWAGKDELYKELYDGIRGKTGNPLYAFPKIWVVQYLYCRTDMFTKAGVKLPSTLDEFYEAAKKLTLDTNGDGKIDQYGYGMRGARGGHNHWIHFIMADIGGDLVDENGNARFNTPEGIAANQRFLDLYKNGYTPKTAPKDGAAEIPANLEAGVTAMAIHLATSSASLSAKLDKNITAVPLPTGKNGRWVVLDPQVLSIFNKTKYPAEAFEFIKFFNEKDNNDKFARQISNLPANIKASQDAYYQNNTFFKVSIDSLKDSHVYPPISQMGEWTETLWPTTMQRALAGEITSKQMIEILAAGLKKK